MIFDDGSRRVELRHFGMAHTRGDAFAWLPQERILFSGDACVNGPFNYVGDGHVGTWISTLEGPKGLGLRTLCPGHGPVGSVEVIEDQQAFFRRLVQMVERRLLAKVPVAEISAAIEQMRAEVQSDPRIAHYATPMPFYDPFPEQIEKVYEELTGTPLGAVASERRVAAQMHARAHGRG